MNGTPPLSPKGATTKDMAAAAGLVDQSASATLTGVQQDEVAACLVTEKPSAAALERQKAYDMTLVCLTEAEEEACVAASARDAALARADRERAATKAAAAALAPLHDDGASSVPAPVDLHGAMLLQEAAALNLHAQAVAVNNIRSLIPIVLDADSSTFNCWRDQFLLNLDKFSLQDHVDLDALASSPNWDRMDCVIKSWILGSLTDDLIEITSSQGGTARDTWLAVES
jgi:hypothetical protein